jgi:hypothetical protein
MGMKWLRPGPRDNPGVLAYSMRVIMFEFFNDSKYEIVVNHHHPKVNGLFKAWVSSGSTEWFD